MADFCKQCSEDIFGFDTKDHAHGQSVEEGYGYSRICEGCGFTMTDHNGVCLYHNDGKNGCMVARGEVSYNYEPTV